MNVGCIPKKLMHHASLLGQGLHDATEYGWQLPPVKSIQHDWKTMTSNIHAYIKGTNWGYKNTLRDEKIDYINALGTVKDGHNVEMTEKNGTKKSITAAHIIVAVGGRPKYPEGVEGAELGITRFVTGVHVSVSVNANVNVISCSDDLFWLPHSPGKTLLVGAGYVALECAGFLTHLGLSATVMARGQVLRGFDQQISEKVRSVNCHMSLHVYTYV